MSFCSKLYFFSHFFSLLNTICIALCTHYFEFCVTFPNVYQLYLSYPLVHWWTSMLLLAPEATRINTSLDISMYVFVETQSY